MLLNIKSVELHHDFPKKVWIVVEQPFGEAYRMAYDARENVFVRTEYKSLLYERGFRGAYGWIGGLGTPPEKHYDILLVTEKKHQAGDILLGYVCGIFYRSDGDHKVVALDAGMAHKKDQADMDSLDEATQKNIRSIYPRVGENEGWYGVQEALAYLEQMKTVEMG